MHRLSTVYDHIRSPRWGIHSKILKITMWLTLNNKILTWDNLQKRGWKGPNRCALCFSVEEIVTHFFHFNFYAEAMWKTACSKLEYQGNPGTSLEHKANAWWKDRLVRLFSSLPFLFTHGIWWVRNTIIFNNKLIPIEVTSAHVI